VAVWPILTGVRQRVMSQRRTARMTYLCAATADVAHAEPRGSSKTRRPTSISSSVADGWNFEHCHHGQCNFDRGPSHMTANCHGCRQAGVRSGNLSVLPGELSSYPQRTSLTCLDVHQASRGPAFLAPLSIVRSLISERSTSLCPLPSTWKKSVDDAFRPWNMPCIHGHNNVLAWPGGIHAWRKSCKARDPSRGTHEIRTGSRSGATSSDVHRHALVLGALNLQLEWRRGGAHVIEQGLRGAGEDGEIDVRDAILGQILHGVASLHRHEIFDRELQQSARRSAHESRELMHQSLLLAWTTATDTDHPVVPQMLPHLLDEGAHGRRDLPVPDRCDENHTFVPRQADARHLDTRVSLDHEID